MTDPLLCFADDCDAPAVDVFFDGRTHAVVNAWCEQHREHQRARLDSGPSVVEASLLAALHGVIDWRSRTDGYHRYVLDRFKTWLAEDILEALFGVPEMRANTMRYIEERELRSVGRG